MYDEKRTTIAPSTLCPNFDDYEYMQNPIYSLSEDQRLSHFLTHGTNNQIVDFRSGLYFNIIMNRSLAPPLFFRRGVNDFVTPNHHVDMVELSKLITITDPQKYGSFCKSEENGDLWLVKSSQVVESRIKMSTKWWKFKNTDYFQKEVDFHNGWREQPVDKMHLLYQKSNASCSAMEHPIRGWTVNYNQTLMNEIIRATPRPKYIRDLATRITRKIFGFHQYSALHWRYNQKDFMKHCPGWDSCPLYDTVTKNVEQFCRLVVDHLKPYKLKHIYLAAPPNEIKLINQIKQILTEEHGYTVATMKESQVLMHQFYPHCEYIHTHEEDVFSTIEQEISFQVLCASRIMISI